LTNQVKDAILYSELRKLNQTTTNNAAATASKLKG